MLVQPVNRVQDRQDVPMQVCWWAYGNVTAFPHTAPFLHLQPEILCGLEYCIPLKQSYQGEKRALCDWTLRKCIKEFLHCNPFWNGAGKSDPVLEKQMHQMTPPVPLEPCCVWMLKSINLRVIFDLQLAFVFNFLYIIKLHSIQHAADLVVLGAHQVICLEHTVIPDGYIWYSFITIILGGLKFQVCDRFLGSMIFQCSYPWYSCRNFFELTLRELIYIKSVL